jgi:hypothetical protein
MFRGPHQGRCVHISLYCAGGNVKMGYEGITVALWMLLITWVLVAIIKLLF